VAVERENGVRLHRQPSVRARERGVMLIEALVAILIFSIGILAVVGMQGVAIKDVTAAKYRSEAAYLAQQLLSQMWTDNANISQYAYAGVPSVPTKISAWVNKVQTTLPDSANANAPTITLTNLTPVAAPVGATVQITLKWRLPEEISQGLPAHTDTVIAYVYPAPAQPAAPAP
jgi:type IV pilus assembly protein PilV